jgi:D-glycero-D-manno-heptose 1,7-bisphosphate phosphatase
MSPVKSETMKLPAIFLDRDGVIIENRAEYVRSWEDVAFIPGVFEALSRLSKENCRIVLVTNQSAVGRGLLSYEEAISINGSILEQIKSHGGRVDGSFICPHAPWENCTCRKPSPGLLLKAAEALSLDLPRSAMLGDALSDLKAGRSAGVALSGLVLTGRGREQNILPEAGPLRPFPVYKNLGDAVTHLLAGLLSSNVDSGA